MLRDFVDRILALSTPIVTRLNGVEYCDKKLIPHFPVQLGCLSFSTLTGLVKYLNSDEPASIKRALYLRVADSTNVYLFTAADISGSHNNIGHAKFEPAHQFHFGQYMSPEAFIIQLKQNAIRTGLPGDHYDQVLKLVSSISVEHLDTLKDTGLTQQVATRRGVEVGEEVIPAFVHLVFRRSFPEVNDNPSEFFLRIRAQGQTPTVALFESTHDAWEAECCMEIWKWLEIATAGPDMAVRTDINLTILE
jgi:hypothetical protein